MYVIPWSQINIGFIRRFAMVVEIYFEQYKFVKDSVWKWAALCFRSVRNRVPFVSVFERSQLLVPSRDRKQGHKLREYWGQISYYGDLKNEMEVRWTNGVGRIFSDEINRILEGFTSLFIVLARHINKLWRRLLCVSGRLHIRAWAMSVWMPFVRSTWQDLIPVQNTSDFCEIDFPKRDVLHN